MENTWNFSPVSTPIFTSDSLYRLAASTRQPKKITTQKKECRLGAFKPVTPETMKEIWPYLQKEKGRTTDFSYAGVLMWVDYFNYEYVIYKDTLFIKGVVESDRSTPAFSLPIGDLPLKESVGLLKNIVMQITLYLSFRQCLNMPLKRCATLIR